MKWIVKKQKAFTLIELLVVLAIMALVLGITAKPMMDFFQPSRHGDAKVLISSWIKLAWTRAIGESTITKLEFIRVGKNTTVDVLAKTDKRIQLPDETWVYVWKRAHLWKGAVDLPSGIGVAPPYPVDPVTYEPDLTKDKMCLTFLRTGPLCPQYAVTVFDANTGMPKTIPDSDVFLYIMDFEENPPILLETIRVNFYTGRIIK